jgi:integrase
MVVSRLIEEAGDDNPDLATFLQLAATTGARRGELCGLHWVSVDFEQGTVTIARSIVEDVDGHHIEKDTKTHSVRRVALDRTSMDALRLHRERCRERARACEVSLPESVRIPRVFVHPFRLNPYTDSGVFVHPGGTAA